MHPIAEGHDGASGVPHFADNDDSMALFGSGNFPTRSEAFDSSCLTIAPTSLEIAAIYSHSVQPPSKLRGVVGIGSFLQGNRAHTRPAERFQRQRCPCP